MVKNDHPFFALIFIDLLSLLNIVRGKDGSMSGVSSRAITICQLHSSLAGEQSDVRMIHVSRHSHSFRQQEAMVLAQAWVESHEKDSSLKQVKPS